MANSNWRDMLVRRYRDWRGEKKAIEKQIADVTAAYEALEAQRARLDTLDRILESVEVIMAEVRPDWNPDSARPTRKGVYKMPFEVGAVTRWTLDILRQAKEPMRSRAIAEKIMELNEFSLEDTDLTERIRVAADATLRNQQKRGLVDSVDTWPMRWKIVDHGDRPTAEPEPAD